MLAALNLGRREWIDKAIDIPESIGVRTTTSLDYTDGILSIFGLFEIQNEEPSTVNKTRKQALLGFHVAVE